MLGKISGLSLVVLCVLHGSAVAGQTTRVNVSSKGEQAHSGMAEKTEFDQYAHISADGHYVAFKSYATNLVTGKKLKANVPHIFVHDLWSHKTELASFAGDEKLGDNHYAVDPSISGDGRYVVFTVGQLSNNTGMDGIFVRDLKTHSTQRVDVAANGTPGNGYSVDPYLSANGRYVVFSSYASNLVHGDTNKSWDIFLHDLLTHDTQLISSTDSGGQSGAGSFYPVVSADGRYVAFTSEAANLVSGDTNNSWDVFVYDRLTSSTERVSVASNGKQGTAHSSNPSLSADGRYVAFSSSAPNFAANDNNGKQDIFVHDRLTHKTERVSNSKKLYSDHPSISADGRYVAFLSVSSNNNKDAFIYDRLTHKTEQINVKSNGAPGTSGHFISREVNLSADGRYVQFDSEISNLVPKDTNGEIDIFVRDRLLDTTHHADLKISTTTKPTGVKRNSQNDYVYTITNNGQDAISDVILNHWISGASTVNFKPSQGQCSLSSAETVCHLGKLAVGKRLTVQVTIKAETIAINQQLSVSGAPVDNIPSNNHVSVVTPVK